jgi:putative ABC transport system permease protein
MAWIPVSYNLRSLFVRKLATVLTLTAIALSVAVLVAWLALAKGFERSLTTSGSEQNVIVLRKGATSEGVSAFSRDLARTVMALGTWDQDEQGRPVVEPVLYAAFSLEKATGGTAYAPLRGVGQFGFTLRPEVKVASGRPFKPGTLELVVGKNLIERLRGCRLGGALAVAGKEWPIVGVMDSGGGAFDSEIWGDTTVLVDVFDRDGFNAIMGRVRKGVSVAQFLADIKADQRLNAEALTERGYFREQAGVQGDIFQALAIVLAAIMSLGAMFGASNTLAASVSSRTREIGAMLAIGFSPGAVFVSFLLESLLLGLMGGAAGVVLGSFVNGWSTGTMNWATFTEQTFSFEITWSVIAAGMLLAALTGLLGGALPAWRASRLKPMVALKAM